MSDSVVLYPVVLGIFVYKNNVQTQLEVFPGICLIKKGFRDIIKEFKNHSNELVYLHKDGVNVWDLDLFGNEIWVLGDQRGLGKDNAFVRVQARLVSVSSYVLHAEHCISIVHNKIDNEDVVIPGNNKSDIKQFKIRWLSRESFG